MFVSIMTLAFASLAAANTFLDARDINTTNLLGPIGGNSPAGFPGSVEWPNSYAAIGDSFSAGVGAGRFADQTVDTLKCARMDKSYPMQTLADARMAGSLGNFEFWSCSGDKLEGLTRQLIFLPFSQQRRSQVVTLSISGNDFGFSDVVKKCVYGLANVQTAQGCLDSIKTAGDSISNQAIWDTYRNKVQQILNENLWEDENGQKKGVLVINGYPAFFAEPKLNDKCMDHSFVIKGTRLGSIPTNPIGFNTRVEMNAKVRLVNQKIQEQIISIDPDRIKYVDLDSIFEGHRFCEPGLGNSDPEGANNPFIWFNSFGTNLEETGDIPSDLVNKDELREIVDLDDVTEDMEQTASLAERGGLGMEVAQTVFGISSLRIMSVFHPTVDGHQAIASGVLDQISRFASDNGLEIGCGSDALQTDCANLQFPSREQTLDMSVSPYADQCFTNGNRKWCTVAANGNCFASIGWDTTENNGKAPFISSGEFQDFVASKMTDRCGSGTEDVPGFCSHMGGSTTLCGTGKKLCVLRAGFDCQ